MVLDNVFCFVVTPDSDDEVSTLLSSLLEVYPSADYLAYTVSSEQDKISNKTIEAVEHQSEVFVGDLPIFEYPISSKTAALAAVEDKYPNSRRLFIDTDVVLLNRISIMPSYNEVAVKSIDWGDQHWARQESENDWEKVYRWIGAEYPGYCCRSTVDQSKIPPYYNAGVILSGPGVEFGSDWKQLTKKVYNQF
jgi:hypothetical protein